MIIIGAEMSGPELSGTPIDKAIRAVMKAESALNGDFQEGSIPAVNVVFCVAGSLGEPDWEHGRIGKYSSRSKLVLVQAAVPQEMVHDDAALDYADAEKIVGEIRQIAEGQLA